MSFLPYYRRTIQTIYVDKSVRDSPALERAMAVVPELPVVEIDGPDEVPEDRSNGGSLYLHGQKGEAVTRCPGTKGHLCCNYLTVELYAGCTLGCSYCIMRSYLNFAPISITLQTSPAIDSIRKIAADNPDIVIRVGTGEVGDSLLFDPLFGLSEEIIRGVSDLPNVYFEMKTKTDYVDHLLGNYKKGHAVIGFSLGPEISAETEEGWAAPIEARLSAAGRAIDADYLVAFHFDPMFYSDPWRELYFPIVDRIGKYPSEKVAWVSLGTFRYPPQLRDRIADRRYVFDEFVLSKDGKYRYIQRLRSGMYREMREAIRHALDVPVYLCMESSAVWKRAFGGMPSELPDVSPLFRRPIL